MGDVLKPLGHKKILENELEGFGIRMNKAPPNIIFKKKDKGGINLQTMVPQSELDLELISIEELEIITKIPHCVPISAHHKWNYDSLLEKMWEYLKLIRIYTKPKGQLPDYEQPVILQSANGKCTVEDFCNKIHRTIINELKYALVWGTSAKHQPMRVGRDHVLHDEDVVQIVKSVK